LRDALAPVNPKKSIQYLCFLYSANILAWRSVWEFAMKVLRIITAAALLVASALATLTQSASATTCTGANGTTTLPGTNIGTVGSAGCDIGSFSTHEGQNSGPAIVNTSGANPSIYQFSWGGGYLTIQEEVGNNGSGHYIDVEVAASGVTLNSDGSLSSNLVSTVLPYSSGPIAPVNIISDMYLAAGNYILDTYLGTCAPEQSCSGGSSDDPDYQVRFSDPAPTPLPAALPLFASGLGVIGLLARRRKRKALTSA
jgi:hypothetical protein